LPPEFTGNQFPLPAGLTVNDTGGAAAWLGKVDVKDSPYFKTPDFYNMKSGGSLTLLEHYKTYQQTTALYLRTGRRLDRGSAL
jgi:hypothetical protein